MYLLVILQIEAYRFFFLLSKTNNLYPIIIVFTAVFLKRSKLKLKLKQFATLFNKILVEDLRMKLTIEKY